MESNMEFTIVVENGQVKIMGEDKLLFHADIQHGSSRLAHNYDKADSDVNAEISEICQIIADNIYDLSENVLNLL